MRLAALAVGLAAASAALPAAAQGVTRAIPGDPGWELTELETGGCFARLPQAIRTDPHTIDTIITINRDGLMALSAGRPDWSLPNGEENATLRVDNDPPVAVQALPVGNFVMILVKDPALQKALDNAHRLTWKLPAGEFATSVSGIGKTFDVVRGCGQAAAAKAP